jgi:hypothetical protein
LGKGLVPRRAEAGAASGATRLPGTPNAVSQYLLRPAPSRRGFSLDLSF